jgi:hypothetical protein
VLTCAVALGPRPVRIDAQTLGPDDIAYCTVRVARVAPVDAAGTLQAVVLLPTVAGTATVSGTLALFTSDDRTYDVPFGDTVVTTTGASTALLYRFARPVVITGAYVDALGGPSAGPCTVSNPWRPESLRQPSASADAAIAQAKSGAIPPTAVAVREPGTPDPLRCGVPYKDKAAHLVRGGYSITPLPGVHGNVVVQVTIGPNGKPTGTEIARTTGNIDDKPIDARIAREDALAVTADSIFETEVFRCRHVVGTYEFIVEFP